MKHALSSVALALAFAGLTAAANAAAAPASYAGHELVKTAKVSLTQAEQIAIAVRPGKITDRELEREGGGSGLRWSFDIKAQGKVYEVGVDASTGKILENKAEGPHPD